MSDIHSMKIHEQIEFNVPDTVPGRGGCTYFILRVPGGWIYSNYTVATFVPYSSEGLPSDNIDETDL